ncbi:DUF6959 family protein [Amycolatopsis circi]|uniref:DUF6959 family protein n=1 Tax=Amycolatopsis circi TaxID=871959 RepID=UPI000E276A1A|nr:hypothetical protein [Amycolatopsis circi]
MQRIKAELFTDPGNNAVVRMPGRKFPGVLIQGDSLSILRGDLAHIVKSCAEGDLDEARESAAIILADLDAMLDRYCDTLRAHDIPVPFARPD